MTALYEYFYIHDQSEVSIFFITPVKMSGYTRSREPMAREPVVALLMTASGSLDIFYEIFSVIFHPSTRLQTHQQHHAAPEVALTVRSMLLKRKFRHLPLFKMVGFA